MKPFLDKDFLLSTQTAKHLYHDVAEELPIIDYHCHLDPKEIYEDRRKWAETLSLAIGNPLYHWSHLELRRYFGYEGALTGDTAEEVWQLCNDKLAQADMSARQLILRSRVTALCTTDDPADSLEWHRALAADESFPVKVLPSFRPDKALGIEKADYLSYLARLGGAGSFGELKEKLIERLDYFCTLGCRVSDHGMAAVPYAPATETEVEAIFQKRLRGEKPTANARRVYKALGPDAGIDSIGDRASVSELAAFLNALDETGELPKTILYSLDPNDNAAIETVMGAFQSGEAVSKLQHGSAWWFNDHKRGMTEQLESLAAEGYLAGFVGMLTDSRSFLSYARHEYFRRILCELIGSWVENGEYPNDERALRRIVEGICYRNAEAYFNLD